MKNCIYCTGARVTSLPVQSSGAGATPRAPAPEHSGEEFAGLGQIFIPVYPPSLLHTPQQVF